MIKGLRPSAVKRKDLHLKRVLGRLVETVYLLHQIGGSGNEL